MFSHRWAPGSLKHHIFLWNGFVPWFMTIKITSFRHLSAYSTLLTTHLDPRVKGIVLWLDRIHILAIIKMISCYHDNWRCIKLFSKIIHLSRKYNVSDKFKVFSMFNNFVFKLASTFERKEEGLPYKRRNCLVQEEHHHFQIEVFLGM